ncbi:TetR family transcriptional regulator [Streptomyces sediminimaris]|uniref:TetR family transcriptional regulator n=1 Tax=Streptomyces sediminimaris TaxID=3383721 RepID=UPI00399A453F
MPQDRSSPLPELPPDPPRVAWRKQMRARVLAEARALAAESGWDGVRVADLALRAEVSRPSIYKEFGDRAGIGRALVQREAEELLCALAVVLKARRGDLGAALEAAVAHVLAEADANPFVGAVLTAARGGTDALLPFLTSRPEPVFSGAWQLLAAWLGEVVPQVSEERRAEAADLAVRLTLSHMLLPAPGPEGASTPTSAPTPTSVPAQVSRAVCAVLGVPVPRWPGGLAARHALGQAARPSGSSACELLDGRWGDGGEEVDEVAVGVAEQQ